REKDRAGTFAEVFVILDRGLQRVALEEHAALEVAEAIRRRARGVPDDSARLVDRALTGDPGAPAEVDVLEVGEVVVVEAAELEERFAARDHGAAAGEEDGVAALRVLWRPERHAEPAL